MITHVLASVQQTLRQIYGPHHYYTTRYGGEELSYWEHIPGWLEPRLLNLDSGSNVLDIGPGYGTLACVAATASKALVVAIDRLPLIDPIAANYYKLSVIQEDFERNTEGIHSGLSYDVIICTEVLEHFNFYPSATLQTMHDISRKGAHLLLSTPDSESWGKILPSYGALPVFDPALHSNDTPRWIDGHCYHYNEPELRELLGDAGFAITKLARSRSNGGVHINLEAVRIP